MKEYDVIVVGSGSGAIIAEHALNHDLKVALIDEGPLGGTCLNVGCIPSKMLISSADRVMAIREAARLGIHAEITKIDFAAIMGRMRASLQHSRDHMIQGIQNASNLDFYDKRARFVDDHTMEVEGQEIRGEKIFLVSGARPLIPPIRGLDEIDILTNESLLGLNEAPRSLIIVGGGYIAAEYSHFFSAMGTKVTVVQMEDRLVPSEEPEVSALLHKELGQRMTIHLSHQATEASRTKEGCRIVARDLLEGGTREVTAERVLIAAGRKSNADLLQVDKAGILTDQEGFIEVDDAFVTNRRNIWALGDAIGRQMFKHAANEAATIVSHNAFHGAEHKLDLAKVPRAIFTHPQIAAVGMTEEEARKKHNILVGKALYSDVAKGQALREEEAFAKLIVEQRTWRILGFHIIGPHAAILIQEVVNAMWGDGTLGPLVHTMVIHPALTELIQSTIGHLEEPE